jgi:hypothetical protein
LGPFWLLASSLARPQGPATPAFWPTAQKQGIQGTAVPAAAPAESGEPKVGGGGGTAQGALQRGEDPILGGGGRVEKLTPEEWLPTVAVTGQRRTALAGWKGARWRHWTAHRASQCSGEELGGSWVMKRVAGSLWGSSSQLRC